MAIGSSTGEVADAVNAGETAKVAVEDNLLKQENVDSLAYQIGRLNRYGKKGEVDKKIWSISQDIHVLAYRNWKEIESCYANPTNACYNKIRSDYSNVNFDTLKGLVHENANAVNLLISIERRNSVILNCNGDPVNCLEDAYRMGVAHGMATANLIGGSVATSAGIEVAGRSGKGNVFRGGSKSSRDNWYGYNDKNFQRWWHRVGKKDFGGQDIDNAAEEK